MSVHVSESIADSETECKVLYKQCCLPVCVCVDRCYHCMERGHICWRCPNLKKSVKTQLTAPDHEGFIPVVRQGTIQQMVSQQAAAAIKQERKRKQDEQEGIEIIEAIREQQEIAAAARKEKRDKHCHAPPNCAHIHSLKCALGTLYVCQMFINCSDASKDSGSTVLYENNACMVGDHSRLYRHVVYS